LRRRESTYKKKRKKKKSGDMQIQQTERAFRYSGLVLPDPDPSLGIEAVRSVYASSYPEITTAAVSGPELVDRKHFYTFKTAVGTKGLRNVMRTLLARRESSNYTLHHYSALVQTAQ
jgi:PRTRC genetic system protein C